MEGMGVGEEKGKGVGKEGKGRSWEDSASIVGGIDAPAHGMG